MTVIIAMPVVLLALIAAFGWLFWKLASRSNEYADCAEWFESFSLDSYTPLERLLDQRDFRFLEAQPGYKPDIGKRLVKEHKRLFLDYLRLLTGDFNQLLQLGRLMIVYSSHDRVNFARALRRQQIAFYSTVCAVRLRLAFYPLAWNGLDVPKLVAALGSLHKQIQQIGRPISFAEPA